MTSTPRDDVEPELDLKALDEQFEALEARVDPEARSEARVSQHAWEAEAERDRLKAAVKALKEQNRHLKAMRQMRKGYAKEALSLARAAVMFWVGMFTLVGISNVLNGRVPFSDQALVTITAGATVNVLAAFIGIIRGLFPAGPIGRPDGGKKEQ